jgi:hypothetical protein
LAWGSLVFRALWYWYIVGNGVRSGYGAVLNVYFVDWGSVLVRALWYWYVVRPVVALWLWCCGTGI